MLALITLENEKYVSFTTFRKDGRPVSTPVWLVQLSEGELGFSTGSDSGKAKRLRRTARVTLQACDRRGGSAHGPILGGQARLVSGAQLEQVRSAIRAKYGAMATAIGVAESVARLLGSKRDGAGRVGVLIHLDPDPAAVA
jgi:PPOX class probable F420-dependent enzyme